MAWEINGDAELLRRYWPELDNRGDDKGVARIVASDIESMDIRFLDAKGKWQSDWPPPELPPQPGATAAAIPELLPVAVEIRLLQKQIGEVLRVVPVR